MGRVKVAAAALAILVVSLAVAACGGDDSASGSSAREAPNASGSTLPQGSEPVKLDPADFTTKIDNPHWPMQPGNKWVYRETDTEGGVAKVVVKVTDKTKTIANGVEAVVVSDIVSEDGKAIEITDDWYAQDK